MFMEFPAFYVFLERKKNFKNAFKSAIFFLSYFLKLNQSRSVQSQGISVTTLQTIRGKKKH